MAIQKRELWMPPAFVPGKDVKEILQAAEQFVKSDAINYNDTDASVVFHVPANTLVIGCIFQVTTVWNGTLPSVKLGIAGTTGRHFDSDAGDGDLKTVGFYRVVARPWEYTANANLIVSLVTGGATTGIGRFWIGYRPVSNKQKAN